jgi:hypothetical protein
LSKNRNKKKNEVHNKNAPINEKPIVDDQPVDDEADVKTLQKFIDHAKLQNDVLRKMLENIHQSEKP